MSDVRTSDLERSEFLSALPAEALLQLARRARRRTHEPGQTIVREGDTGESMFVLLEGEAKAAHPTDDGGTVDIRTIPPGEVFGELAVFDPAPRSASVVAVAPCTTVEVHKSDLDEVLDEHPAAARRVLGTVARSLTYAREQVIHHNRILDEKVRERTREVRETQLEVIRRLGSAVECRDGETGEHIFRMSQYAARLGRAVGMSEDDVETLLNAAPMHDVGKIGVPDRILLKPGPLDDEEWVVMRSHTTIGADLLDGGRSPTIKMAQQIALTHHERWDGAGYPQGLAGEEIPLPARICSVSDVFDALTTKRPYKRAWTVEEAVEELHEERGKAFDPGLVDLFEPLIPELVALRETEFKGFKGFRSFEPVEA